jgi:hypothetical protein
MKRLITRVALQRRPAKGAFPKIHREDQRLGGVLDVHVNIHNPLMMFKLIR